MKKYFVFAVAAVIATAACTKNEVINNTSDQAISFQVANYVPQTKANVAFEGTSFKTSAWFHADASSAAQPFMASETIKFQSNNTWAADRIYFWPKTGWINFFSWAGSPEPAVTEGAAAYGTSSAPVTIATDADAMLASAAYRYGNANYDTNLYTDPILYNGVDTKGVPTLFHHMLAQVNFIVKFDAQDIASTSGYKWDLIINSVSLNYGDEGYLNVVFTDPGSTGQAWPFSANTVNWTRTDNTDLAGTLNLGAANKQTTAAGSISEGKDLYKNVSVLPQEIGTSGSNAKLALNYTLISYYNDNKHIEETIDLTGANAIAIAAFTNNSISQWNMNYKYTYTVTIKPTKTVTFDPAVEAWQTDSAGYTYPND
jgi:hypothetical protein